MPSSRSCRPSSASLSAPPAAIVSRAPARPSVAQTTWPNDPVAPTTIADLPATSKRRGQPIPPEWYKAPVYYKGNHRTIIGPDEDLPWPLETNVVSSPHRRATAKMS